MNWHCLMSTLRKSWALGTGDTGCIQQVGLPSAGISDGRRSVTGHKVDLATFMKQQPSAAVFQLKTDLKTLQVSFRPVTVYWVAEKFSSCRSTKEIP